MAIWPNWVDLIVVIALLRACYNGFGRGALAELLNVIGAVGATTLAINYWDRVARLVSPWVPLDPTVSSFLVFGGLFLSLIFVVHIALRRVAELVRWERLHWSIQGLGLILGGVRGLWWSGIIVIVLASSGFAYLRGSVVERSVLGPQLLRLATENVVRISHRLPGGRSRTSALVPPMRPNTP